MGAEVRRPARKAIAEIGSALARLDPRTPGCELKPAGLGRGIESGAADIHRHPADAVRLVARRNLAVVEIVVEAVVDVQPVAAVAQVLRASHFENIVPR